jgi:hypothetical protein
MKKSPTTISVGTPIGDLVQSALDSKKVRKDLVDALGHQSRALREYASQALIDLARADIGLLQEYSAELIDALSRPESLTRYSMIEILGDLAKSEPKIVLGAYEPLQECLYDEDSGTVRLYAFRVLARYGATGPARSLKVWPDLSMALRSFHGDPEFMTMMSELIAMLGGRSDASVKEAAVRLFAFDAEHAKGELRKKAEQIASFAPEVLASINEENEKKKNSGNDKPDASDKDEEEE